MDKSDVITLIASTKERDSKGVYQATETTRKVFCSVESVGQREFLRVVQQDLNHSSNSQCSNMIMLMSRLLNTKE